MAMIRPTKHLKQTSIHMYFSTTNAAVEYDELLYFIEFLIKVKRDVRSVKKQHKINKFSFMSIKKNFYVYCFILVGK